MPETRYPQRGKMFYAHRYMAHVLRSGVAMQFGCEAVALLLSVALTEDKTRYSKAVLFWNDQLTAYLGCRVDRLVIPKVHRLAVPRLVFREGHGQQQRHGLTTEFHRHTASQHVRHVPVRIERLPALRIACLRHHAHHASPPFVCGESVERRAVRQS